MGLIMGEFELPFMKKQRTIEELQEDNERLRIQAENEDWRKNIALSQAEYQRLKNAGLTKNSFGSASALWAWLNKTK